MARDFRLHVVISRTHEVTSVGLVVPRAKFIESKKTPQEFFLDYLPQINPPARRAHRANFELVDKST